MLKKSGTILFIFLLAAAVIFWLRFFSAEDGWICQNDEWVKHGNPSSPKPLTGCGQRAQPANIAKSSTSAAPTVTQTPTTNAPDFPGQVTLTGLYVCLPTKNGATATTECALGLRTDDGNYFSLNTKDLDSYIMYPTGTRLRVFGRYMPIEMDSTNLGRIYNVKGIINLAKVEETDN